METEKLKYLLTIQKEKSISKAAESLFMTQPSLSKMVSSVELSLGFKIFDRTSAGLIPTPMGIRYLNYAAEAIKLENRTLEDLEKMKNEDRRKLVVFGLTSLRNNATVLHSNLLNTKETDVRMKIVILPDDKLLDELETGTIDFALFAKTEATVIPSCIRWKELYTERVFVAVSDKNPLCEKAETLAGVDYPYLEPDLLADQPFTMSTKGNALYDIVTDFFEKEQLSPDIVIYDDFVRAAKRYAQANTALCFVNEGNINPKEDEGIRYFLTADTLAPRHVVMAWNRRTEEDSFIYSLIRRDIQVLSGQKKKREK